MMKSRLFLLSLVTILSGCNLYGSLDKPSGDAQLISAARACLNSGDYVCARERYEALSSNSKDIKLSELAFTTMAENQVFSISDLISSLGSNLGGIQSYISLSEIMASRGKEDNATRGILQASYASNAGINNVHLKAFMQFLTALATFNQVMSAAVGPDGKLTAGDLVATPAGCQASNCLIDPECGDPNPGSGISDTIGDVVDLETSTGWTGAASFGQLQAAANASSLALNDLGAGSSFQGILDAMKQIDNVLGAAGAACKRQALQSILFP